MRRTTTAAAIAYYGAVLLHTTKGSDASMNEVLVMFMDVVPDRVWCTGLSTNGCLPHYPEPFGIIFHTEAARPVTLCGVPP